MVHSESTREYDLEYSRRYRREHPDKVRENVRRYYWKHLDYFKERNKKTHAKWNHIYNAIHNPRKIRFKDKRIELKDNPRTGVCNLCRRVGLTNMHHLQYHDDDPLKDTIELCPSCHGKQHIKKGQKIGQVRIQS